MKQQRRHYRAEEKAKISLEAISCQQRATLEKRNAPEERQKRECCGSTELPMRAEQRVVQEGSSPSGARMRGAISKSGANSSLAEESRRYADV
jgi:hypothetical protein